MTIHCDGRARPSLSVPLPVNCFYKVRELFKSEAVLDLTGVI